ncbi:Rv3654c family TadE-like protein, partial [Streptomyces wuyuanensis]|uniref:Rv3654c family TadE-like protein n=1 Tax=Streptomyces wuyuanensis TaxID=1196353 RepID=UPI00371A96AB
MTACAMCVVFAAVLAMGQVVVARHRAGAAADLAALAAADRALEGTGPACARAARVARAQGAEVVRCAVAGEIADVTAGTALGPYRPETRSRAGPPDVPGRTAVPGRAGRTPEAQGPDLSGPPRPLGSGSRGGTPGPPGYLTPPGMLLVYSGLVASPRRYATGRSAVRGLVRVRA